MRVTCKHCGAKMTVSHSRELSEATKAREIYADCQNHECLARSVYILNHHCDLTPPLELQTNSLIEQLAQMSPMERQAVIQMFQTTHKIAG